MTIVASRRRPQCPELVLLLSLAACAEPTPQERAPTVASSTHSATTSLSPGIDWGTAQAPSAPIGQTRPSLADIAVSPDGKVLATIERDEGLSGHTWLVLRSAADRAVTRAVPVCLAGKDGARVVSECSSTTYPAVKGLVFSPDGASLGVGCSDCAPRGASFAVYKTADLSLTFAVPFSEDVYRVGLGKERAVVAGLSSALVLNAATGAPAGSFRAERSVSAVSPDAALVFAGDALYDVVTGSLKAKLPVGYGANATFFDGGVAVADSTSIKTYGLNGKEDKRAPGSNGADLVRASSNGRYVVVVGYDGTQWKVTLADMSAGVLLLEQPVGSDRPSGAAVGPTGRVFVSSKDGVAELEQRAVTATIQLSPDGSRVATVDRSGDPFSPRFTLRVRDARALAGKPLFELALSGSLANDAVAFSPTSDRVVFTTANTVEVYSLPSGKLERSLPIARSSALRFTSKTLFAFAGRELTLADTKDWTLTTKSISGAPDSVALDGSGFVVREQPGAYEEPMPGGGHRWIQPPAHLDLVSLPGLEKRELVKETQGSVLLVDADTYLKLERGGYSLNDKGTASPVVAVPQPIATSLSPGGRFVAFLDGNYWLYVHDLSTTKEVAKRYLRARPASFAVDDSGAVYLASASGGLEVVPRDAP
ncbi:MAG: hypothetical protein U0271_06305 [Polyangiaceae bacterium]